MELLPIDRCRGCGASGLRMFLDLGRMPLVDSLALPDSPPDALYPLRVTFCEHCGLAQLLESPPPALLFPAGYPYFSSVSSDYLAHAAGFAREVAEARALGSDSLVIEIASNDGYLLRAFAAMGIPVLGIDPAPGPARAAIEAGVPTRIDFFDRELAEELWAEGVRADLVVANNVLAHVPDPNGLLQAMARLLKPGGRISIEVPYLQDLIDQVQFDTIYHEHHSYFSVTALKSLLERNGLQLIDVQRIPVHGGSLRLAAGQGTAQPRVYRLLDQERERGLADFHGCADFAARVEALRNRLLDLVEGIVGAGRRLAGYGAAAKGAVLLNYLGLGPDTVEFVVDRNPRKHGMLIPGVRIPIVGPGELVRRHPSHALLLAWNWAPEILRQQEAYTRAGGRFIIPIPSPRILPEVA